MVPVEKSQAAAEIPLLEKQFELTPNSRIAAQLATCYFTTEQTERAIPLMEAALEKNREGGWAMNLALMYKDVGRHDDSMRVIEYARLLDPNDEYIRLGYSEALLRFGFWKKAWPVYDHARPTQAGAALSLGIPSSVKEWNGEPLPPGHLLFVINEGGTGDRLSYPRWLPKLTEMGINWKFHPYETTETFFLRHFPRERISLAGDQFDPTHWTTTFSLPAKLCVGPNEIPPPIPLTAAPEMVAKYLVTSRKDNLPVVGLCWEANEMYQGGRKVRSMTEGQAMRLVCMTSHMVHWVNLQHKHPMPFPILNIPFDPWEELAGLIHNLDAVVSVDTGPMHLAGCLGKPMVTMLSANSCWKFMLNEGKCRWYPTAKIFRNPTRGFEQCIDKVAQYIREGGFSNLVH